MEKKVLFSSSMHSIIDDVENGVVIPDNTITHIALDDVVVGDKITNRYGNETTISSFYGDSVAPNDDNSRGMPLKDHLSKNTEFVEVSDDNTRGIHLKDHLYKKNYTKKRHKRK